jgi:hypothetical protein
MPPRECLQLTAEREYGNASDFGSSVKPASRAVEGRPPSPFEGRKAAHQVTIQDSPSSADTSRAMRIDGLINYDSFEIAPRASPALEYNIIIRQQPRAARACGFGDRDRRAIDPPPILEMIVHDPNAPRMKNPREKRYPQSVVHCELWNADEDVVELPMPEAGERHQQRKLMGTLVSSPFVGRDEFDKEGCFFPFPDLSCRTTGRYRLKFVLVIVEGIVLGESLPVRATVLSNVFEVYTAKTFPGMEGSTDLTKRLKEQGCLISVKKGHQRVERFQTVRKSEDNEEEPEEDDISEGSGKGKEKKQKT